MARFRVRFRGIEKSRDRARAFFFSRGDRSAPSAASTLRPPFAIDQPPDAPHGTPPRPSAARARTHPIVTIFAPRGAPQRSGPSPPQSLRTRSPRAPGDARTTWVAREQSSPHTSPPRRRIESSTPTFARALSPRRDARVVRTRADRYRDGRRARSHDGGGGGARASQAPSERASTGGYAGAPLACLLRRFRLRDDRERAPGEHVSPGARSRPLLVVVVDLRSAAARPPLRARRRLCSRAVSRRARRSRVRRTRARGDPLGSRLRRVHLRDCPRDLPRRRRWRG